MGVQFPVGMSSFPTSYLQGGSNRFYNAFHNNRRIHSANDRHRILRWVGKAQKDAAASNDIPSIVNRKSTVLHE